MSRLIVFYCLMIAGVLSQSIAEPIECEIHISGVSLHSYHYDVADHQEIPSVHATRTKCTRNREASWQHQLLTHYTKDDFAQWAAYKNISTEDLFGQYQLYQYKGFVALLRTHPEYEVRIAALYSGLVTKYERFASRLCGYLTGTYTPGLYKQVAHEFTHVQERIAQRRAQHEQNTRIKNEAAERTQQEARAAIESHTRKSVQENQQSLKELRATWRRYPNHTRLQKRATALNTVVQNQDHHYTNQEYQLDANIYQSAQYSSKQIKTLQSCYGNAIQQTLHQEFVEIVHRSVESSINHVLQTRFNGLLPELVTLGLDANNAGHVAQTSALADCCWALLDCAHALTQGFVDGCCATAQSVVDAVTHPINTASELISSVATLLHTVASAVGVVPQLGYYYITDTERYYLRQNEIAAYAKSLLEVVNNYVATTPRHQIIRQSTAFITQAVLTDRLLKVGAHVVAKIPALLADVLLTQKAAEPVYALFGMDLMPNKEHLKLGGFHHDYLGKLEKEGIIQLEMLKRCEEEFYKAQVWVAGTIAHPPKTFFPQNWTPEQVVGCIAEAYCDSLRRGIKATLQRDGKYLLEAQIKNGPLLRFHLDQKMNIKSVFPYIEG